MKLADIISHLESIAPPSLQESYDNAGLLTGNLNWECTGVICTLDAIEDVVTEAIAKKCNLIVAHHPIIFTGLKKVTGKNYVEKTIIAAIKNDIAKSENNYGRIPIDSLGIILNRNIARQEELNRLIYSIDSLSKLK